MKKLSATLVLGIFFLFCGFNVNVFAEVVSGNKYIVYFDDEEEINSNMIIQLGGEILFEYENIPALLVDIPDDKVELLRVQKGITHLEKDKETKVDFPSTLQTEREPQSFDQYTPWGIDRVNAWKAWESGYTGKGVKVAVLDSGIATNHKDLTVHGGASFVPYTNSYNDDQGHGTHVAGIIAAKDNSMGVVGVAPDAKLYAVKVIDYENIFWTSNLIKGIDWSINNDMDIINMSLSTWDYVDNYGLSQIIKLAHEKGILIVSTTGNTGMDDRNDTVNYPGKYPEVIAVASIDGYDRRAEYSSFGQGTDIAAPGDYIYSTYLDNSFDVMSGTSMAAPHVAGVLALMKEKFPHYTNVQLRDALVNNTLDLGAKGWDPFYGFGLVQADFLLEETNKVSNVTLDRTNLHVKEGETRQLNASVYPENAVNKKVNWVSNNSLVASVDRTGMVTAIKQGTAVIKVQTEDGGFEASAIITVEKNNPSENGYKIWEPVRNVPQDKKWSITYNQLVDVSTSTLENIYVTDSSNRIVPTLNLGTLETATIVVTPKEPYQRGQSYTLWIKNVRSVNGDYLKENVKMDFTISN